MDLIVLLVDCFGYQWHCLLSSHSVVIVQATDHSLFQCTLDEDRTDAYS